MPRLPLVPVALLLAVLSPEPVRAAAPHAAANDSLLRTLTAPVPSLFAPTVCVIPEDQDPAALRRVLDAQLEAWNRGDLEGYMTGYWKSDSLTFFGGGDIVHGWQVTLDRYRKRYQSEGREMGQLGFEPLEIVLLGRGQALVRGGWRLRMKESQPHGLFTLWLRWFPDAGWRIVHDHSSAAP